VVQIDTLCHRLKKNSAPIHAVAHQWLTTFSRDARCNTGIYKTCAERLRRYGMSRPDGLPRKIGRRLARLESLRFDLPQQKVIEKDNARLADRQKHFRRR
jgi:hypothetical protein